MEVTIEYDDERSVIILHGDITRLSRNPVFSAYRRQNNGALLDDGTIAIPAQAESLATKYREIEVILNRLNLSLTASGNVSKSLAEVKQAEENFSRFSEDAKAIWHGDIEPTGFSDFVNVITDACPGRTFFRLQLLSAYHLAFAQHACNFSVPGSGKTSIVYCAFAYLSRSQDLAKHVDRILVVGPLSSFKAWEDEFEEIFLRPAVSCRLDGQSPQKEREDFLCGITPGSQSTELILTSYQAVDRSPTLFRRFLERQPSRTMLVLDEAHYIKRPDGQWSQSVLSLSSYAASRVALTGTPAPNGYEDLANIFEFIHPGRNIVGFSPATLRAMTEGRMRTGVDTLTERLRAFYTRIRKSDLSLRPPDEERIHVPMSSRQRTIYDSVEALTTNALRSTGGSHDNPLAVAKLVRLLQSASNPELLRAPIEDAYPDYAGATDNEFTVNEVDVTELIRSFDASIDLEKLRVACELVDSLVANGEKVLIWSIFLKNLDLLHNALKTRASYVGVISGSVPTGRESESNTYITREAIIGQFHRCDSSAVLIANPQAVGESISLHKACHSAIYFDRDFNAGRFIQSKDRIHRVGLPPDQKTTYYYLISNSTIDDVIDQRLTEKEERMQRVIDSEDIPLFAFAQSSDEVNADIDAVLKHYEQRHSI